MSGQAGVRGYVYQAIVAILKALGEKGWDEISVEYYTPMDKVDIALLNNHKLVLAIQVKSSINLFTKADVISWLDALISDVSASRYEVTLLGSPDKEAVVFINSISQYYQGENTEKMRNSLKDYTSVLDKNKIEVCVLPFNPEMLLACVRDMINQYIGNKGYVVKQDILAMLAENMLGFNLLLATKGKFMSREEYDKRIFGWLNLSCGEEFKNNNEFSSIEAVFYYRGEFLNRLKPLRIRELESYIRLKQKNIRKLIEIMKEISEIDVLTEKEVRGGNTKNTIAEENLLGTEPCCIDDRLREYINSAVEFLLDQKLDDDFFNFGSLKKKKGMKNKRVLIGTDEQKRKDSLMWKFIGLISDGVGYENYAAVFEDVKIFPIVLRNNGQISDQNIEIILRIPETNVKFLDLDEAVDILCSGADIAKNINDKNITNTVWTPAEDENVGWRCYYFNCNVIDAKRNVMPQSLALEKEKALEDLKQKIQYEETYHKDGELIIKSEINALRPGEAVLLSKYLVFKEISEGTVIKYNIISQRSSGTLKGHLFVE